MSRLPLILLGLLYLTADPLRGAGPRLVSPDPDKLLLLDRRVVESVEGARLVPGRIEKEPRNPLFQADKPWENSLNNLYPNVLWDEEEQIFKLWYKCVLADPDAIAKMDGPSTVHDVGWYLLYATSRDGVIWDKPALGLHAYDGDSQTNIVARDTPNVGVFKDTHDTDATRRYKMVYDTGLGQLKARFSGDGIHWGDPVGMKGFGARNGDTHNNAFFDEKTGKYLWFTKLYLGERLVARAESTDFLNWTNNGLVLRSDLDEGRSRQTYCLPVFRYGNIYLGYAMIYDLGKGRTVDCELAWSPDGLKWERVIPGTPLIPRGPKGSYDSECIYAMAGPPVAEDGNLLIYYGGDDFPHTGWKRDCLPCLARLPLDHFAGYEPGDPDKPATVTTRLLRLTGAGLRMTAAGGPIKVEALDPSGAVVAAAGPVSGDLHEAPLDWISGADRVKAGAELRFRFELNQATLFAIDGAALIETSLPQRPSSLRDDEWTARPAKGTAIDFTRDTAGWGGVDKIAHQPEGGAPGGFVRVSREGRNLPIALSGSTAESSPFAGDWPVLFGGRGAGIRLKVRAPREGGKVQIEVFARDVAQWTRETDVNFGTDWREVTATLRYGWTDAEAAAAGWKRSAMGFSWEETMRNVGKLVVVPTAAGPLETFDLDEVEVRGISEEDAGATRHNGK
jgi:hypothetical protein